MVEPDTTGPTPSEPTTLMTTTATTYTTTAATTAFTSESTSATTTATMDIDVSSDGKSTTDINRGVQSPNDVDGKLAVAIAFAATFAFTTLVLALLAICLWKLDKVKEFCHSKPSSRKQPRTSPIGSVGEITKLGNEAKH